MRCIDQALAARGPRGPLSRVWGGASVMLYGVRVELPWCLNLTRGSFLRVGLGAVRL
jgi:hypothetical protein